MKKLLATLMISTIALSAVAADHAAIAKIGKPETKIRVTELLHEGAVATYRYEYCNVAANRCELLGARDYTQKEMQDLLSSSKVKRTLLLGASVGTATLGVLMIMRGLRISSIVNEGFYGYANPSIIYYAAAIGIPGYVSWKGIVKKQETNALEIALKGEANQADIDQAEFAARLDRVLKKID